MAYLQFENTLPVFKESLLSLSDKKRLFYDVQNEPREERRRDDPSQEPSTLPVGPQRARRDGELQKGGLTRRGQTAEREQRRPTKDESFRKRTRDARSTNSCVTSATAER